MKNYYEILGVSQNSETEVIMAAYKAMMRKYHPDKNPSNLADEKSKEINEAYEVLIHPDKRKEFDSKFKKSMNKIFDKEFTDPFYYQTSLIKENKKNVISQDNISKNTPIIASSAVFIIIIILTIAIGVNGLYGEPKEATEDGETAEYTIDKATGETSMTVEGPDGTTTLRSGADVPVSLPAGFSLFPGSKVITNTVVNQPGGQGTMVMFEADAAADTIIAHYRDQAKAAGFAIQIEMNTNGTLMIGAERERDGSTLSITATDNQKDATTGQIIIGSKTAG